VCEKRCLVLIESALDAVHVGGELRHISLDPIDVLHLLVICLVIMKRSCDLVIVIQVCVHFIQCVSHQLLRHAQLSWKHVVEGLFSKLLLVEEAAFLVYQIFGVMFVIELSHVVNRLLFVRLVVSLIC